jgi:hypothetical protein
MDNVIEITKTQDGRRFVKIPQKVAKKAIRNEIDLPVPSERANPIALVVIYDLYGLSTAKCSTALGFTEAQIEEIRQTDVYNTVRQTVIGNISASEDNEVKAIFVENAKKAAQILVNQLDSNTSSQAISAALKILNYAGHGPKKSASEDRMSKGLQIVIVDTPKTVEHGQ